MSNRLGIFGPRAVIDHVADAWHRRTQLARGIWQPDDDDGRVRETELFGYPVRLEWHREIDARTLDVTLKFIALVQELDRSAWVAYVMDTRRVIDRGDGQTERKRLAAEGRWENKAAYCFGYTPIWMTARG